MIYHRATWGIPAAEIPGMLDEHSKHTDLQPVMASLWQPWPLCPSPWIRSSLFSYSFHWAHALGTVDSDPEETECCHLMTGFAGTNRPIRPVAFK